MNSETKSLYKKYARGAMDRREFLEKLAALAGGTAAAAALLPALESESAAGQVVPKDDPRLETKYIKYPAEGGEIRAYQARPKGAAKLAGVIVIHENRGLNPHTEDIARRVALEGFMAIAPDALTPLGGTPESPDDALSLIQKLDREVNTKNFVAAVAYLKTNPQATGKVGCMGFCWGGGVTNQVAVHSPDLAAAVPFYGLQPAPEDVPKIKAAMLIHDPGLRRSPPEGRYQIHDLHVRRRRPCFHERYRQPLQQRSRRPRLAAIDRLPQGKAQSLGSVFCRIHSAATASTKGRMWRKNFLYPAQR
jgi:carboxymethylenebutenolidase